MVSTVSPACSVNVPSRSAKLVCLEHTPGPQLWFLQRPCSRMRLGRAHVLRLFYLLLTRSAQTPHPLPQITSYHHRLHQTRCRWRHNNSTVVAPHMPHTVFINPRGRSRRTQPPLPLAVRTPSSTCTRRSTSMSACALKRCRELTALSLVTAAKKIVRQR